MFTELVPQGARRRSHAQASRCEPMSSRDALLRRIRTLSMSRPPWDRTGQTRLCTHVHTSAQNGLTRLMGQTIIAELFNFAMLISGDAHG